MATEKWVGGSGVGFTWTACFSGTDLTTTIANASSLLSSVADVTNQTSLDIFCDFSFAMTSTAVVAPNNLGVYLYPLNEDGTSYGDGNFVAGTVKAATPSATYFKGTIIVPVGTAAVVGTLTGIIMPPGSFRFAIQNNLGVTTNTTGNTYKYRTYNRQVV